MSRDMLNTGHSGPFVMHLERVCQLIEMGQRFTVEFHPYSDVGKARGTLVSDLGLQIRDGGEIALQYSDGSISTVFRLTLANYKRIWRCWQNGKPQESQCRATKWRA